MRRYLRRSAPRRDRSRLFVEPSARHSDAGGGAGLRPGKEDLVPSRGHARKPAGASAARSRDDGRSTSRACRTDASHADVCLLAGCELHPADDGAPAIVELDIDAAYRVPVVDADRLAEADSAVGRRRDIDPRAVARAREPGDGDAVSVGRDRWTVDRAGVDLPVVGVNHRRTTPAGVRPPHDTDVANLSFEAVAIGDDRP